MIDTWQPPIRRVQWRDLFIWFEVRSGAIYIHQARTHTMALAHMSAEDYRNAQSDLMEYLKDFQCPS